MKKILVILLVVILAIAGAGYWYYKKMGDKIYPEFVRMERNRVADFKLSPLTLTIGSDVVMHNYNIVGAEMTRIEFDVYAEGYKASHVTQAKSVIIKAESDFTIPLLFDVPLYKNEAGQHLKTIRKAIVENKKIKYKMDGKLFFNIAGSEIGVPFEYEDVMPIEIKSKLLNL